MHAGYAKAAYPDQSGRVKSCFLHLREKIGWRFMGKEEKEENEEEKE